MLHKAVVIDNSMLFTRGTIRVRIAGLYHRKIVWDLEERFPDAIEEGNLDEVNTQFSNDYEAQLATSFGGGRNYGVLSVPQINEKGLVAFLGGSKANPVWLGGLFETRRSDSFDVEFVNLPSDKFEDGENTDGVIDGEGNIGDDIELQEEKSIILRTKHTRNTSQEEIDFQKQDTSNIISLGKNKIRMTHFPEGSWVENEDDENKKDPIKYKDFLLGKNEKGEQTFRYEDKIIPTKDEAEKGQGEINSRLEINQEKIELIKEDINEENPSNSSLYIDNNILKLNKFKKVDDKENHSTFIFNEDNTGEISITKEDKITSITMGEETLSLKVIGDKEVDISVDGTDVTIATPDVTFSISGSNVTVTAANFHFDGDAFKIAGGGDNVSLYTPLEKILNELLTHVHTAPSGPTTPAEKSDKTPLVSLKPDVIKIKSQTSTTD